MSNKKFGFCFMSNGKLWKGFNWGVSWFYRYLCVEWVRAR